MKVTKKRINLELGRYHVQKVLSAGSARSRHVVGSANVLKVMFVRRTSAETGGGFRGSVTRLSTPPCSRKAGSYGARFYKYGRSYRSPVRSATSISLALAGCDVGFRMELLDATCTAVGFAIANMLLTPSCRFGHAQKRPRRRKGPHGWPDLVIQNDAFTF